MTHNDIPATKLANPQYSGAALCGQTDPELFFPELGQSPREAKAICNDCELAAPCLDYAVANDERFGVWGAHSARERRDLKQRLALADTNTDCGRLAG
ncbi:MAG: WhiB family transcriptional regulator [Actinomycetia bacterium]|nr:WhiB family transcriptional regulator [Actinomycetes bacterium]